MTEPASTASPALTASPPPGHGLPAGAARIVIDNCWRRIGVLGDSSCPQLAVYIRCRNCPAYSRAALELLDNLPAGEAGLPDEATPADGAARGPAVSCLVFRVGEEWLALPAAALAEVTAPCPVHTLPHRRHAAVLGLASVRGNLLVCISLARLLGQDPPANAGAANGVAGGAGRGARLLVLGQGRGAIALPVDEVTGIERVAESALQALPTTLSRASARYARALLQSGGRSVGLLDAGLLQQALTRSLA
ncbi:chemotaxis protein CheW [Cupriavidus basilensis]|uniref:chemotaxis protein CheW n=1 Tax=Cupriavidus basilensis TaxID=68895 RepID=UPI000ADF17B6|nr:chemotaxis protein CheW [Cupriavidus basilensis]